MSLTLMFFVIFLIGPLVFWGLAGKDMSKRYFTRLLGAVAVTISLAFILMTWAVPVPAFSPYAGISLIALLWLSWIVALVLCVMSLRAHLQSEQTGRWTFTIGAMATTLPWFGLILAQIVATT